MSDLMLLGMLRMPMDNPDPLTLRQFVDRARQAADRIEADEKLIEQLRSELDALKRSTQLCEEHEPSGGTRAMCLVCACEALSSALSRIDYAMGEPNEMECSDYDVHCDEDAVVERAQKMAARLREIERNNQDDML